MRIIFFTLINNKNNYYIKVKMNKRDVLKLMMLRKPKGNENRLHPRAMLKRN
jgi:hypothetical protein